MSIRLILLGALGARAYRYGMRVEPPVEDVRTAVGGSAIQSQYLFAARTPGEFSIVEPSQGTSTILGYQPMDPRVRASLRKLQTQVETALRACSTPPIVMDPYRRGIQLRDSDQLRTSGKTFIDNSLLKVSTDIALHISTVEEYM
ncbi:unnamed protein product [Heligmosomoides polygyrus]|uniref:MACPF domain-containing protein n=1 Tax=Heligmosomoides polygyrus TaxID=6339 RepID=A0A183GU19_HELPZ|nr:unnamed protein product [Heligmosomoides polygyrus]